MNRTVWMCTLSAMLGALLAVGLVRSDLPVKLWAQDAAALPGNRPGPPRFRTAQREPRLGPLDRPAGPRRPTPAVALDEFTPEERVNIAVYENVNRSVVNITTHSVQPGPFLMFEVPTEGSGSGSVLDKAGHILTNYHVIAGSRAVDVTLYNGKTYEAGLVGQDPQNDIAVLRIDAPPDSLFPVVLGDSSRVKVGQKVYAIGNPLGLERTLTVGIVSSLNRTLPSRNGRTIHSVIQIDAALNRGNSGGPLMNSRSQLIGMNTAIASPSGAGENIGIGFAIPVNAIRRVVPQLIERGRVLRADIGITVAFEPGRGVVIAALSPGGPAERAGLRAYRIIRRQHRRGPFVEVETYIDRSHADRILAIDGQPVNTFDELLTAVESKKPGQEVIVTVLRDGREVPVAVVLGEAEH